jgi:hypothetical protein
MGSFPRWDAPIIPLVHRRKGAVMSTGGAAFTAAVDATALQGMHMTGIHVTY